MKGTLDKPSVYMLFVCVPRSQSVPNIKNIHMANQALKKAGRTLLFQNNSVVGIIEMFACLISQYI